MENRPVSIKKECLEIDVDYENLGVDVPEYLNISDIKHFTNQTENYLLKNLSFEPKSEKKYLNRLEDKDIYL